MIIPDTNLLIYAYNDGAPHHAAARRWLEDLLDGDEAVGVPWIVATSFARLMANERVIENPLSPRDSISLMREWFSRPHVFPIEPGDNHLTHFERNLIAVSDESGRVNPNLVPDAHIAAMAIERNAEVHTNDNGFARFDGLRWRNPLA